MKQLLIAVVISLSIWLIQPAKVSASGWVINNFQSDITINADGTVSIAETIDVDFGTTPKHGIFRDIPYRYYKNSDVTATEITVNSVTQDHTPASFVTERNANNLRIKIGDAKQTITGNHSYEIRYTATGILRGFPDYDELYWNVTGDAWEVWIKQAGATVHLPSAGLVQAACYEGLAGSIAQCAKSEAPATTTFTSTKRLAPGEGMTVAVGYTKGLVPLLSVTPPINPLDYLLTTRVLLTGLVIMLLGIGFAVRRWLFIGRDRSGGKVTIVAEYEAPASLRPAEIGVLIDEHADTLDISATIVDLAVRGYLTITEQAKKWLFGEVDYLFTRTTKDLGDLLEYEQALLTKLFETEKEVRLSKLKYVFYNQLIDVKKLLYAEITRKGLFVENPEAVRNNQLFWGGMIAGGGILLAIFAGKNEGFFSLGITQFMVSLCIGLIPTGFMLMAITRLMPARTKKGSELYRQAKGFELFINTAEKYRAQFAEQENRFTDILPYAIVFKSTKKLAKAMEKLELTPPQPAWYVGPHPFHAVAFASTVNNFSSSLSQAMAATPGGSGSGGGGFSGGGFGGGGGGSW